MACKRSLDEQKLILHLYERGNSYYESPIVLGISRRICHDIVGRFTMRDDLRDACSYERPWFLDERVDCEVVRWLLYPFNGTTATLGRDI